MHSLSVALAPLLLFTAKIAAQSEGNAPTATIESGPLRGRATQLTDSTVNQFLGIPFAQPPLDELRFAPPQEPESWDQPLDVTEQPDACMQWLGPPGPARDMNLALFYNPPPPGESEDCLYLNVYVPEGGEPNKSVLFWVYGGSGLAGAISQPIYDGTTFAAAHDIIVVAANYRLTVFGTPRAPQLSIEDSAPGRLDQRAALEWVNRNIAAFGGDPEKVTIAGESNGGLAAGNFINTYPENPPFRAGIEMSGSSVISLDALTGLAPVVDEWAALMELLNCTNTSDPTEELECARAADAEEIITLSESNGIRFSGGAPDNVTALERVDVAWANGNVARVPLLIGSTGDDGSPFALGQSSGPSNSSEPLELVPIFESAGLDRQTAELLAALYDPTSPFAEGANTTQAILAQIITDITFRCTSTFTANLTAALLNQPVWQYVFDAVVPSSTWEEYPTLGAYHASEVPILFGTYRRDENTTEAEDDLSRSLQKQFADFIKDPNAGPGWDQWPQIAVLDVDQSGAVTTTEPADELDAVCAYYYPLYLTSLPALAQLGSDSGPGNSDNSENDGGDSSGGSDDSGDGSGGDDENAGIHHGIASGFVGGAAIFAVVVGLF